MKAFENSESILSAKVRKVSFHDHDYVGGIAAGSYQVIQARLFNMTFAEYLQFIKDNYNATLVGKTGYTTYVFHNSADCDKLVAELNKRWAAVKKWRKENDL